MPNHNFYYLIGMRVKNGDSHIQYSFWANNPSEEKDIWRTFICTLENIKNPTLIHYGEYEKIFFEKMMQRYPKVITNPIFSQTAINSINLLSKFYGQIYFPTYTNGLKDIAKYLGFQWSENITSGLDTIVLRQKWEVSTNANLKQKLLIYNSEDCEALELLTRFLVSVCQGQVDNFINRGFNIDYTSCLEQKSIYRFGRNKFSIEEMDYINKAAYFDYQKEKVFIRKHKKRKPINKNQRKQIPYRKNTSIETYSEQCPSCSSRKKI